MRNKSFGVSLVAGFYWNTDDSIRYFHSTPSTVLVQKIQFWFQFDLFVRSGLPFFAKLQFFSGLQLMMNWFNSLRPLRIKEFSNIDATLKLQKQPSSILDK